MKKFVIENEFWELFPTAKIGIIVANDIDNTIKDEAKYAPMLAAAEKRQISSLLKEILAKIL